MLDLLIVMAILILYANLSEKDEKENNCLKIKY